MLSPPIHQSKCCSCFQLAEKRKTPWRPLSFFSKCTCACMHACMRACEHMRVFVCVCVMKTLDIHCGKWENAESDIENLFWGEHTILLTFKFCQEFKDTQVWSMGQEDPLEKEMAIHSSILAWEISCKRSMVGYSPWGCSESEMT